jgi:AraC-like DNA-binding protein
MTLDNLFYLIAGGALLQSAALILLLLRRGVMSALPPRLLAVILTATSLNILHALTLSPGLLMEPLQFLLPPLFAAYVRSLVMPGFRLKRRMLLHFIPAVLAGAAGIVFTGRAWTAAAVRAVSIAFWAALLCQAAAYLAVAIRDMRAYREALKGTVSTLAGADPSWLRWFSRMLHGIYIFYVLVPFLVLHLPSLPLVRNYISLVLSLSLCALCYRQLAGRQAAPREIPETARVWPAELPGLLEKLMTDEKPWLDPELDLDALSRRLGWTRNEVSAAINGHFGRNFHDFVNAYRVAEVKALMDDPAKRGFTLVALALEAGFNSKPTFNAVFKKQTGLTPSGYFRRLARAPRGTQPRPPLPGEPVK